MGSVRHLIQRKPLPVPSPKIFSLASIQFIVAAFIKEAPQTPDRDYRKLFDLRITGGGHHATDFWRGRQLDDQQRHRDRHHSTLRNCRLVLEGGAVHPGAAR